MGVKSLNYLKFIVKRLLFGVLSFFLILLMYSAVLNTLLDATAQAQIFDMVMGYMMSNKINIEDQSEIPIIKKEIENSIRHSMWLDKPVFLRVFKRAYDSFTLNFGESATMRTKSRSRLVKDLIFENAPGTLILFGISSLTSIFLGFFLGTAKAKKPGSPFDLSSSILTMLLYGTPSWWLGSIMILIFSYTLKIFPSGAFHSSPAPEGMLPAFFDRVFHLALPLLTMIIIGFWGVGYIVKNLILSTLQEDYITSARARGIPERKVLLNHAARASAPPIVTMAALQVVFSINGNIPTEKIFSWPGLGTLLWEAITANDIPLMMGTLTFLTLLFVGAVVILDLIYCFLDPRIKTGHSV